MNKILAFVTVGLLALTTVSGAPSVESAPGLGVAVAAHHAAIVTGTQVAGGVS